MANVGDVVELGDGSIGVVGELLPLNLHRVFFDESVLDVLPDYITQTLSAPSYNVGDEVSVWPWSGTITAIDGSTYTVEIERQRYIPALEGAVTWTADHVVEFWRLVKDNDSRIERIWGNEG